MPDAEIAAEVTRQIDKLVDEGPPKTEIDEARGRIVTSLLYDCERVGGAAGKAGILALSQVMTGDPEAFNNSAVRMQKASADDVKKVVSTWISAPAPMRFTIRPVEESSRVGSIERPDTMPPINWADAIASPTLGAVRVG